MSNIDTEQEERCLRGFQTCELPLDTIIGGKTKGEIMEELQSIINKQNEK